MAKTEDTIRTEIASIERAMEALERRLMGLRSALGALESGGHFVTGAAGRLAAHEKKQLAFSLLETGPDRAKTPAAIHDAFANGGVTSVTVENIRTILWRAARNGEIGAERGRYWKLPNSEGS